MERYSADFVPNPFGLMNTGSICYFNSLMQAIVGCPALNSAVLDAARTKTAMAYRDFVRSRTVAPEHSPPVLQVLLGDVSPARRAKFGNGQECASEAFMYFSEAIGDEFSDLFSYAYSCDVFCPACDGVVSNSRDSSTQLDLFFLGNAFVEPDAADGRPTAACASDQPRADSEFIQQIMRHRQVLDDYECPVCRGKGEKIRTYNLVRLPDILVCIFDIYGFKHPRPVVPRYFPRRFEVPARDGGQLGYRLVGQVEHFGSMGGGHYVARGLRRDGRVYNFNDSAVSPGEFAATPNTYMVVYHIENCPDRFARAR